MLEILTMKLGKENNKINNLSGVCNSQTKDKENRVFIYVTFLAK